MQRGTHEHQAQVGVFWQQLPQLDQQKVGKLVPLMHLINHYMREARNTLPMGEGAQQDTVGAEHQGGVWPSPAHGHIGSYLVWRMGTAGYQQSEYDPDRMWALTEMEASISQGCNVQLATTFTR